MAYGCRVQTPWFLALPTYCTLCAVCSKSTTLQNHTFRSYGSHWEQSTHEQLSFANFKIIRNTLHLFRWHNEDNVKVVSRCDQRAHVLSENVMAYNFCWYSWWRCNLTCGTSWNGYAYFMHANMWLVHQKKKKLNTLRNCCCENSVLPCPWPSQSSKPCHFAGVKRKLLDDTLNIQA